MHPSTMLTDLLQHAGIHGLVTYASYLWYDYIFKLVVIFGSHSIHFAWPRVQLE